MGQNQPQTLNRNKIIPLIIFSPMILLFMLDWFDLCYGSSSEKSHTIKHTSKSKNLYGSEGSDKGFDIFDNEEHLDEYSDDLFNVKENGTLAPTILESISKHTASVIFLHGMGDSGLWWTPILSHIRQPCMKVICPNAQEMKIGNNTVTSWFSISKDNVTQEDAGDVNRSVAHIHHLLDEEIKLGIRPNRIILGGYSQGAAIALRAALTYSKKLGGVVAYCAWLPAASTLFKHVNFDNQNIHILQGHGDRDDIVSYKIADLTAKALKRVTLNLDFRKYEGAAHLITPKGMEDIKGFLQKQVPEKFI